MRTKRDPINLFRPRRISLTVEKGKRELHSFLIGMQNTKNYLATRKGKYYIPDERKEESGED